MVTRYIILKLEICVLHIFGVAEICLIQLWGPKEGGTPIMLDLDIIMIRGRDTTNSNMHYIDSPLNNKDT